MLHNEARELLLKAWDKMHDAKKIAECFSVNTSTVYRLVNHRDKTGEWQTRTHLRGRKSALSQEQKQSIILSSIRINGEMAYTTYTGGITAEKFRDYLENVLLPTLDDHAVIIMDNMRSHHG